MEKKPVTKRARSKASKEPPVEAEKVIEALVSLKKRRVYPALPGKIRSAVGLPESQQKKMIEYLKALGKQGILMAAKSGRSRAYMLAGDDPRYATKKDDLPKLKFELLGEIEALKAQVLEMQAIGGISAAASIPLNPVGTAESSESEHDVLRRIKALSKSRNRRSLDLWEVRQALNDVSRDMLDEALERLGSSWLLELQLVQDSTKLSDEERSAVLRLKDGSLVGAVAPTGD